MSADHTPEEDSPCILCGEEDCTCNPNLKPYFLAIEKERRRKAAEAEKTDPSRKDDSQ